MTHTTNAMGDVVCKYYLLGKDEEWYLKCRVIANERGSYSRQVDTIMDNTEDTVSLGHQRAFIRQEDGTYLQPAFANYPARIVTSEEIEAAINYVKGKGAAENYEAYRNNLLEKEAWNNGDLSQKIYNYLKSIWSI